MNDASIVSSSGKYNRAWAWLVLSAFAFGGLMAFRSELHSVWLRALVAGGAFALLYPGIRGFHHKP